MVQYVNSPTERRDREETEMCHSGETKIIRLVGIGFGLLCIIQLGLNVYLRPHAFSKMSDNNSTYNSTLMSPDDVRALILERDQLLQDRDQLNQANKELRQIKDQLVQQKDQLEKEKSQLQNINNQLNEKNKMLNEKVTKQRNQIEGLQTTIATNKEQLDEEKKQLIQMKDQLIQDKVQLIQDKDRLSNEKTTLEGINRDLTEENRMLNEKLSDKHPIKPCIKGCPQGWWSYMSSCYQLSFTRNSWDVAKQACEEKGAHLVILNHQNEEKVVRAFAGDAVLWIGLRCKNYASGGIWEWVNGNLETFSYWNQPHQNNYNEPYSCVSLHHLNWNIWSSDSCQQYHNNWIMEMQQYVNSSAEGRNSAQSREMCQSGGSRILHIVGITFGLLCIIVSIVGIVLRLKDGAGAGAGAAIPACPPGWSRLLSSCYELSSTRSSWDYAKQDCATKGGHLLILNDRMEEVIVHAFGDGVNLWIGLRGRRYMPRNSGRWTWVDNSPLTYG
ncbi:CD209 antigen-like [Anabas testudineus]|uniref:CD209 antigen-like n=1 Tax=Anabas testudineus TaxID=64144 RepID=UPI000E45F2A6|nr:CD209 antigen-like [Anabas testudineus]